MTTPELPPGPRIVLLATDHMDGGREPLHWGVGDAHPFVKNMRVVAMYINEGVVEIYSFDGAKVGIRELIPLHRARLIREEMATDIFGEELRHAELGYPEDDDDDFEEVDEPSGAATEPPPAPAPEPPNGQATS